jgi:ABC-type branched-subunit amino acid transport system ATPase component
VALLDVAELYAGYGETEILHGVSVHLDPKEIVVIIGPNGAGKSTLAKAIIGILKPSQGTIHFDSHDITGRRPEQLVTEGLAYVPQNKNIFPSLTVIENLEMGAITRRPGLLTKMELRLMNRIRRGEVFPEARRLTDEGFRERVEWILQIFPNLRPKLRSRAGSISGGEQQMVAMGKALVLDPTLLILDEPSAGLAPMLVDLIFQKIREINERGTTILLVEQNAKRALALSHRGYVLEMGRNRYEGKGEALLLDPEVGRLYLGG